MTGSVVFILVLASFPFAADAKMSAHERSGGPATETRSAAPGREAEPVQDRSNEPATATDDAVAGREKKEEERNEPAPSQKPVGIIDRFMDKLLPKYPMYLAASQPRAGGAATGRTGDSAAGNAWLWVVATAAALALVYAYRRRRQRTLAPAISAEHTPIRISKPAPPAPSSPLRRDHQETSEPESRLPFPEHILARITKPQPKASDVYLTYAESIERAEEFNSYGVFAGPEEILESAIMAEPAREDLILKLREIRRSPRAARSRFTNKWVLDEAEHILSGFAGWRVRDREEKAVLAGRVAEMVRMKAIDLAHDGAPICPPTAFYYLDLLAAKVAVCAFGKDSARLADYERSILRYGQHPATQALVDDYENFKRSYPARQTGVSAALFHIGRARNAMEYGCFSRLESYADRFGYDKLIPPCIAQFDRHVQQGKLIEAMEALAALGEQVPFGARFWRSLRDAALVLQLQDRAAEFHKRQQGNFAPPAFGKLLAQRPTIEEQIAFLHERDYMVERSFRMQDALVDERVPVDYTGAGWYQQRDAALRMNRADEAASYDLRGLWTCHNALDR